MKICLLDLVLLLNRARLTVDLLLDFLLRLLPVAIAGTGSVSGLFTTGSGACLLKTGACLFNTGAGNTTRFLLAGFLKISWATPAAGVLFSLFWNSFTAFWPYSFTFCLPRSRACFRLSFCRRPKPVCLGPGLLPMPSFYQLTITSYNFYRLFCPLLTVFHRLSSRSWCLVYPACPINHSLACPHSNLPDPSGNVCPCTPIPRLGRFDICDT